MKKIIIAAVVVVIIALAAFLSFKGEPAVEPVETGSTQNRMMSIENYVTLYISELSPVPEELGGRFYVTHITTGGGKGTVSYEDGHNAYIADFTYETEDSGAVKVTSFTVRK